MASAKRSASARVALGAQAAERERDERFMRECLELAGGNLGLTTPNPSVGCVIVRGDDIVGRGATAPGGRPHAEPQAIAEAGERARGATAYVSFEPCAHHGQTPPCAEALVRAGVRRVVAGCLDPFPPVRGRGIGILRHAGITVSVGVLQDECRRLNEGFIARVTRGRPFVTLKLAMTIDGRIAAKGGDSRWISSPASRALVHRWRREADAVMVGAATIIADNPRLTCRLRGGRDPVRVVIDGRLKSPPLATVFRQRSAATTILVTTKTNFARARKRYGGDGVEIISAKAVGGGIALRGLMREFARRGWSKILIEGGAHLAGAALESGIVDRIAFFMAPRILGCGLPAVEGLSIRRARDSIRLSELRATRVGKDWLLEANAWRPRHAGGAEV